MFSLENMQLTHYHMLIRIISRGIDWFNKPMAILCSLNYFEFKKQNLDGRFNECTTAWIDKHPYVPEKMRPFYMWGEMTRIMHGFDLANFRSIEQVRATAYWQATYWLASVTRLNISCCIASQYLDGDKAVYDAVNRSRALKKNLRAWMASADRFTNSMYPHVEALRLAYLAGDIPKRKYIFLFSQALDLDGDAPCFVAHQPLPDQIVRVPMCDTSRAPSSITTKYLEVFGDQFTVPFIENK